jgi:hypothetical protein
VFSAAEIITETKIYNKPQSAQRHASSLPIIGEVIKYYFNAYLTMQDKNNYKKIY